VTQVAERFAVRVMVTDAWDQVVVAVEPTTPVADLKREALRRALKNPTLDPADYLVKFHGAEVFDESITVGVLGAVANSPLIVLPRRRRPVR
jgi:hypothetical protein